MKQEQMKKEIKTIIVLSCICCLFIGYITTGLYSDYQTHIRDNIQKENDNFIDNFKGICDGKNISDTAYCLRDFINLTYHYKTIDDDKTMARSYIEIYKNGGDCLDYSILYSQLIKHINYYDSEIILSLDNNHAYVIMRDYMGSKCVLDLMHDPYCGIVEQEIIFYGNINYTSVALSHTSEIMPIYSNT